MPLLADFSITPDVFDSESYSNEELGRVYLRDMGNVICGQGLVRDHRCGEWRQLFAKESRSWHRAGKELLRKVDQQGRLPGFKPALRAAPGTDADWCTEALAAHQIRPLLGGVIVTETVKGSFQSTERVERIDRLDCATWWGDDNSSVRLLRNDSDYIQELQTILSFANSLQFIDPHLNPARQDYRGIRNLLVCAGSRKPAPLIEIHRVCYEGSGPNREILKKHDLEMAFRSNLASALHSAGLKVEVFVWDDFHDRYLISNLVGISLPNGFNTSKKPNDVTTWTRLGRDDSDDVQREFDPPNGRHKIRWQFSIP